jgi:outer membrane protein assembly factor BamB
MPRLALVVGELMKRGMFPLVGSIVVALTLVVGAQQLYPFLPGETDLGLTPFYAQTGWVTIHRDARNSSFAPFSVTDAHRVDWTALDGAATLVTPSIGPEGHLYVTTGRGPTFSHLHAFDRDGRLLWESAPQQSAADLDSAALLSAPIIDRDGDVYIGDSNQFWAFRPDGRVKWVVDLPPPASPSGFSPFVTAIITNDGLVGGITMEGKVALYHRATGRLAAPILALPTGAATTPMNATTTLPFWCGGLVDPTLTAILSSRAGNAQGRLVINTPAVHPQTGRIYITAAGPTPEEGRLYGVDLIDGELRLTYEGVMGPDSGTSPAISADGRRVYAVDGANVITAFDADTAAAVWDFPGAGSLAAPAVGADGTIYSGGGEHLVALDPGGQKRWAVNYDTLAEQLLPRLRPFLPYVPTGRPVAQTNGVVSVSATRVWVALVLGYEFFAPGQGQLVQPRMTVVAAVDPATGELIEHTTVRDTNEGQIAFSADGRMYVSHAAALSSLFTCTIDPFLAARGVPPAYRLPAAPQAGVTALEPESMTVQVREGITWVRSLDARALEALSGGDLDSALTATRRGHVQLAATEVSIDDAVARGELEKTAGARARAHIQTAEQALLAARGLLDPQPVTDSPRRPAARLIEQAEKALEAALALLP